MNVFILLTALFITSPNPDGSYTTYANPVPPPQSPIGRATRLADAIMVGQPQQYQRPQTFSYDELEERFPVRTVVAPRYTVPVEEQMEMDAYRTERLGRETAIQGQMLNQEVTRNNLDYDRKSMAQAQEVMRSGLLADINPNSPDFDTQVADIQQRYPLAFQNQAFNSQIARLAQSNNQWKQSQEIRDRSLDLQRERDLEYRSRQAAEMRERVASLGTGALDAYNLVEQETSDPLKAYAAAASWAADNKRKQQVNAPLDRQDYIAYSRRLDQLTEGMGGNRLSRADLSPEAQQEYDFIQSEMNRFTQQQQGGRPSVPAGIPTQAPKQDFSQHEGKVIRQGDKAFRVTNGVPVPIK